MYLGLEPMNDYSLQLVFGLNGSGAVHSQGLPVNFFERCGAMALALPQARLAVAVSNQAIGFEKNAGGLAPACGKAMKPS